MTAPAPVAPPAPEGPPDRDAADRRERLRLLALLGVLALLAGALALGTRDRAPDAPADDGSAAAPDLTPLRQAAALEPCPSGLGPALPDLVLPCLGGGPDVPLTAAAPGRPTLVNVWASWCPPCVEEVPALAAFHQRAGDRVGLVGVLTTDTERSALTFAAELGMRWPSLVDDDGLVLRAFPPGPPTTLFLDAQGRVVYQHSGAFTGVEQIAALVSEHLDVQL